MCSCPSTPMSRRQRALLQAATVAGLALLSACASVQQSARGFESPPLPQNEPLVKGPAVTTLVTPFDRALSCLDGRINKDSLRFAVGAITDSTGKEQVTDGGAGKFLTQGAGDIVQSALFMAGASVVNRRDPRIIENEAKWGLIDVKKQASTTFFITGSINSLDFLPGGGYDLQVAGLGPRSRQQRILVGLDLSLTDVRTGRIVANVPLQKQVVSTEDGFGIGRFFGTTLVSGDFGSKQREALNLVLRQMLNLATFELLTQVMNPAMYGDCMAMIEEVDGVTDNSRSRRRLQEYLSAQNKAAGLAGNKGGTTAAPAGTATATAPRQGSTVTPNRAAAGAGANTTPPSVAPAQAATAQPTVVAAPATVATAATTATAQPAPPQGTSPTTPAVATADDPNAGPTEQAPFFSEEQTQTSRAALQALALPTPSQPPRNGNANTPFSGPVVAVGTTASAPASATRSAEQAPCAFGPGAFPPVTPLLARGPGSSLLVRSSTDQTLCLADPSGRFVPHPLRAGVQHRFDGRAPWRLQAERLAELDIVFQGLPLRLPSYVKDRLELLERPWAPPPAG